MSCFFILQIQSSPPGPTKTFWKTFRETQENSACQKACYCLLIRELSTAPTQQTCNIRETFRSCMNNVRQSRPPFVCLVDMQYKFNIWTSDSDLSWICTARWTCSTSSILNPWLGTLLDVDWRAKQVQYVNVWVGPLFDVCGHAIEVHYLNVWFWPILDICGCARKAKYLGVWPGPLVEVYRRPRQVQYLNQSETCHYSAIVKCKMFSDK